MSLLTVNSKMKHSAKANNLKIMNFTLPAFRSKDGFSTCPNAGNCVNGCYARMGAYVWDNVSKKHHSNLEYSQSNDFVALVAAEITAMRVKPTHIRIHDSGDFYNLEYLYKWINIAFKFPNIQFYAYTKMVDMVKNEMGKVWPKNLNIIFSFGGKQDNLINRESDRHSKVFESIEELLNNGYIDASEDDMLALTLNPKVGLVYHGNKNFSNTNWSKVDAK